MLSSKKEQITESNNSFKCYNSKEPAKVGFYTHDEELLYECQCQLNDPIKGIINDFLSKSLETISKNSLRKDNLTYYIKNSDIYQKIDVNNKLVSDYLTYIKDTALIILEAEKTENLNNVSKNTQNVRYLKIYVQNEKRLEHISGNMDEYIIKNTIFIGKPMINELKYYIFNKKTKESKIIKISKNDKEIINIKFFSRMSVYCNAKNSLYIYEGINELKSINSETNNDYNNKFFEINLITHKINMISSKFPKRVLHSMIFIPECYIFIVGGKNTKKVLIYKIKPDNDKYEEYPYLLPYELFEPSLITINNNFLYAFENSTIRFHILRTNLNMLSPFEDIKCTSNISINQKFFGLVKFEKNNSILFLGGQFLGMHNCISKKSYEFNYKTNKIILSEREFQNFDFTEKNLIPMKKNEFMQIAELKSENKYITKVILFNNNLENESDEEEKDTQKGGRFKEGGFQSIDSNKIKVSIPNNIISLHGTSSFGELPIPLYNNK